MTSSIIAYPSTLDIQTPHKPILAIGIVCGKMFVKNISTNDSLKATNNNLDEIHISSSVKLSLNF